MPIPVICGCTAKLKVADGLLGQQIKCPKCSKKLAVAEPKPTDPYYKLYTSGPVNGQSAAPPVPARPLLSTEQVLAQSPLTEAERARVDDELDVKERLLWVGRPDPKIAFGRGWIYSSGWFFMALMAIIVVIIMNVSVEGLSVLVTIGLSVLALVLIGGGFATPHYTRWLARKKFYTVSDRRATIWGCNKLGKVLPPSHFDGAELHGFYFQASPFWGEGIGDLIFGSKTVTRGSGKDRTTVTYVWGFFMLRNAKEVEKIIREALVDPLLDKVYE